MSRIARRRCSIEAKAIESERRARILSTFRRNCCCREVGARERTNAIALSSVCALTLLWMAGCTAFSDPDSFTSMGELCKSYCDAAVTACGEDEDACSSRCKKLAMGRLGDSIGDSAACRAGYAEKADPHTLACEGARLDAPLACNRRESSRCEAYCLWKAINCPLSDTLTSCISDCEALRLAGEATSLDCAIEAARAGECTSASVEACSR